MQTLNEKNKRLFFPDTNYNEEKKSQILTMSTKEKNIQTNYKYKRWQEKERLQNCQHPGEQDTGKQL